jgi:hypothetical protein
VMRLREGEQVSSLAPVVEASEDEADDAVSLALPARAASGVLDGGDDEADPLDEPDEDDEGDTGEDDDEPQLDA